MERCLTRAFFLDPSLRHPYNTGFPHDPSSSSSFLSAWLPSRLHSYLFLIFFFLIPFFLSSSSLSMFLSILFTCTGPSASCYGCFWKRADSLGCEVWEVKPEPRGEDFDDENQRICRYLETQRHFYGDRDIHVYIS